MANLQSFNRTSPDNPSFASLFDFVPRDAHESEPYQVPVGVTISINIELLCSENCLDLEAATAIVLSDVGATLRVFRFAAKECGDPAAVPSRISECIVVLGKSGLLRAFSPMISRLDAIQTKFLQHCLDVAVAARTVAHAFPGVELESAYLAGMFSELPQFAKVFPEWRMPNANAAEVLSKAWSLPAGLMQTLHDDAQIARIVAVASEAVALELPAR